MTPTPFPTGVLGRVLSRAVSLSGISGRAFAGRKSACTLLAALVLSLLAGPAFALSKDEIEKAKKIMAEVKAQEDAEADAKAKAAASDDMKKKLAEAEAREEARKQVMEGREKLKSLGAATSGGSELEERLDELEGKVSAISDLVGRVKTTWSATSYFRSTALSHLSPTAYSDDLYVGALLDVEKFFERNFSGNATIRMSKRMNADDQVQVDLLAARVNYSLSWVRFSVGRQSFAKQLGSTEFLGSLVTAGIHRMDAATITIPLAFTTEIDDKGGFKSPPSALMYGYVPKLLSSNQSTVPDDIYTSGLHFGQFRLALNIERWGMDNTLKLNVASGNGALLLSSPLGGSLAYSAVYDMTLARDYSTFVEYGVQNSSIASSAALVAGARIQKMQTKLFVVDEAVFEYLQPMSPDKLNVLTGGNPQTNGAGAELPEPAWYFRVANRIGKWELGFAMTTSWGDFTFARIRQGALTKPLTSALGPSNEIDGAAVSLLANAVTPRAMFAYSTYRF